MTPQQIVELRAPTYVGNTRVPSLIIEATAQTGAVFGALQSTAIALLVLHWLAMETRGSASSPGAITSESEGQLARSYGSVGAGWGDAYLGQTSWGMELQGLRRSCIFSARNRMVGL